MGNKVRAKGFGLVFCWDIDLWLGLDSGPSHVTIDFCILHVQLNKFRTILHIICMILYIVHVYTHIQHVYEMHTTWSHNVYNMYPTSNLI